MKENKVYEVVNQMKSKKGAFTKLVFERQIAPSAKNKGCEITKHVEMVCRMGINYSNMAAVIERRAEVQPNAYVKTWDWVPGYEHFIKKNIKSGQLYVNFETVNEPHTKVAYTINGVPSTEEDVRAITPPSIWKESRALDTFDVKIENIISINDEKEDK